jgi:hypothetical protein
VGLALQVNRLMVYQQLEVVMLVLCSSIAAALVLAGQNRASDDCDG